MRMSRRPHGVLVSRRQFAATSAYRTPDKRLAATESKDGHECRPRFERSREVDPTGRERMVAFALQSTGFSGSQRFWDSIGRHGSSRSSNQGGSTTWSARESTPSASRSPQTGHMLDIITHLTGAPTGVRL